MRIAIKPVVRPVELGEYAPEYAGVTLWMWVNPPRAMRLEMQGLAREFQQEKAKLDKLLERAGQDDREEERDLSEEDLEAWSEKVAGLGERLYAFWAEVWSKSEDNSTHWTVDEVQTFGTECQDQDPGLWEFAQETSLDAASEYRDWRKKKPEEKL